MTYNTCLRAFHLGSQVTVNTTALFAIVISTVCIPMRCQSAFDAFERRPLPCRTSIASAPDGIVLPSPNGQQYLVSKQDASGIYQLYVGNTGSDAVCISCTQQPGGPAPDLHKMQAHWHPSGQWIILAVEMENLKPPVGSTPQLILGWLQSGIWVNMYVTKPDGSQWYQLTNWVQQTPPYGFTGVAFTPDGTQGVWAQMVNGDIFQYLFGQWTLMLGDFQVDAQGVPSFTNIRNITPAGANWIEPGDISPDGKSLLITADIGMSDPQGMDQYILDITTGDVRDLTNSPTIWDEHGVFSPDGTKVLFMSSYPYRNIPAASTVLFLETEFMLMRTDGSHLEQLTHFNVPGYPESNPAGQRTVAAVGAFSPDSKSITALNLVFPNYQTWSIDFSGRCNVPLESDDREVTNSN